MDSSIKGYKKLLKENPESAKVRADAIIKNTYRTLMTRGQKGCYLYCTDSETSAYFTELANSIAYEQRRPARTDMALISQDELKSDEYPGLTLKIIETQKVKPFINAVPIYNLEIAAGQFSDEQQIDEFDWVELPDSFRPQQGHFVARVVGDSMNKRIPNGAWCLFKANPGGSRNNKIVVVQHRDIQDQDTGAQYTVKLYSSQKVENDDGWRHGKIVLRPDSYIDGYEKLVFDDESAGELSVIGELVAVIG